jgi:hypothetical protein
MCLVILSGFFGIFVYRTYPTAQNELKKNQTIDDTFTQVEDFEAQLTRLAADASNGTKMLLNSAIERTVIGGGYLDQLLGRDNSSLVLDGRVVPNLDQDSALEALVERLARSEGDEHKALSQIVRVFNNRKKLIDVIRKDIRMQATIQVWLLFHVPVTFALIAALTAHIFSVFVYY